MAGHAAGERAAPRSRRARELGGLLGAASDEAGRPLAYLTGRAPCVRALAASQHALVLATRGGELWQLREYVVHRSIYHLKEADPQAWVIPRLPPAAKAGLVTVEHDEYGAGDAAGAAAALARPAAPTTT